jgi:cathepsin B
MEEIRNNGPIVGGLQYYTSFDEYSGGIITKKFGKRRHGYYYAKVLGWGVEDGKPFWLCLAWFGQEWGIYSF